MGDSHAQMWMPALLSLAERDGWAVLPLVKSACTPGEWHGGAAGGAECRAWYRWAVQRARALRPTVMLITGCCFGFPGAPAVSMKRALVSLAEPMERYADRVVVLADNVGIDQEPVDCLLARHATMRSCTTDWTEERFYLNDDLAALAKIRGFRFIDTRGWFCYQLKCPMVVGRTVVYRDKGHITKPYALDLAAPFRSAFRRAVQPAKTG
jgi:hypothetical protein